MRHIRCMGCTDRLTAVAIRAGSIWNRPLRCGLRVWNGDGVEGEDRSPVAMSLRDREATRGLPYQAWVIGKEGTPRWPTSLAAISSGQGGPNEAWVRCGAAMVWVGTA
jgi:hypothetical protein